MQYVSDTGESPQELSRSPDELGSSTLRATGHETRRDRIRTGHACEPCRRRRAKCNGNRPRCGRCEGLNTPCFYAESKAQRHLKEKLLSSKAVVYEALLRSLMPIQDQATQRQIEAALNDDGMSGSDTRCDEALDPDEMNDENIARGDVGSPLQQEVFTETYQSEGYLGKSSAARWLSDLEDEHKFEASRPPESMGTIDRRTSDLEGMLRDAATYHNNELEDYIFSELDSGVDLKFVPPKPLTDRFVKVYFDTIHPFFQVIQREQFMQQYDEFWNSGIPPERAFIWQALLNLILALGCLREQYIQPGPRQIEDVEFFLRARMLSLEPLKLLQVPTRSHVQLTALFAMYLLASSRINRAWLMAGTSIRYALNLGFHLRNIDPQVSPVEKELQKRLWHSVVFLEQLLCFLTGRPVSVRQDSISVTLPEVISHEPVPSFLYVTDDFEVFRRSILLDKILADTLSELYTASTVLKSWAELQRQMADLNLRLVTWRTHVPGHFGFKDLDSGGYPSDRSEAIFLALRYFSATILINRLSLCYHRQAMSMGMPDQSTLSQEADINNARRAVFASQCMMRVLHRLDIRLLYEKTPWWCLLHYVVQGCALLVMEIWDRSYHVPDKHEEILVDAQRGIDILNRLRAGNPAAEKAYLSLKKILTVPLTYSQRRSQQPISGTNANVTEGRPNDILMFSIADPISSSAFNVLRASHIRDGTSMLSPFFSYGPPPPHIPSNPPLDRTETNPPTELDVDTEAVNSTPN